jgi:hypothetical protein
LVTRLAADGEADEHRQQQQAQRRKRDTQHGSDYGSHVRFPVEGPNGERVCIDDGTKAAPSYGKKCVKSDS